MSRFLLLNFKDFGLNQDITQTIQSQTLFCACCLKKNVPLINLRTCSHAEYLDRFVKPKLKQFNLVACYECHEFLKKIHTFKSKVEESFKLLASETFQISDANSDTILQRKKTVDILLSPSYADKDETKEEKKMKNIRTALDIIGNVPKLFNLMGTNPEDGGDQKSHTPQFLDTVKQFLGAVTNTSKNETEKVVVKKEVIEIEVPPAENVTIRPKDNVTTAPLPSQGSQIRYTNTKSSKINTIKLTKEELMRERSQQAQSKVYMKYPYKCGTCIVGFNYEDNLRDHLARKHSKDTPERTATCEICLQTLYPIGSLMSHSYRHYTRYDCTVCNKRFSNVDEANIHVDTHAKSAETHAKFKCPYCDFTTELSRKYKLHRLRHSKFPCKECGVILMTAASRRRHMTDIHNKNKTYKCTKCNTTCNGEAAYSAHMATHAYCTPCNIRFKTWYAYTAHRKFSSVHSKENRFQCEDCGMKFKMLLHLRIHSENRHAKTPEVTCRYCMKGFKREKELKIHMKMHKARNNGNDVMFCDHCGRAYKNREHLKRHLITHTKKEKAKTK